MRKVTIPRKEYDTLKRKADDNEILLSLVRGLEDVKAGRITPWKT